MDLSIIIPHRDRPQALRATLKSLVGQRTFRKFEVLVVDDGSKERPGEIIGSEFAGQTVFFLDQPKSGISAARNTGWKNASGRVIAFLDCDQITKPDFVDNSCVAFDEHEADIIQFGERNFLSGSADSDVWIPDFEHARQDERFRVFKILSCNMASISIGWHLCYGHNVAVRRNTLVRCGGFDEKFVGWGLEDCEFAYRLVSAGAKLVFNPAIGAYHQHHPTLDRQSRFERWLSNLQVFEERHPATDVKLQYIIKEYFDPSSARKDWARCVVAMEMASRAQKGHVLASRQPYLMMNPTVAEIHEALVPFSDFDIVAIIPRREFKKVIDIQLDEDLRNIKIHLWDEQ